MKEPIRVALAGLVAVLSACGVNSGSAKLAVKPTTAALGTASPAHTVATPPPTPVVFPAPVVVQIENSAQARPQSGLQSADIVYEYVAEGGIARLSALFLTPPDVTVGPVRSVRLATIQIVGFFHAVLAYSGASTFIEGRLNQAGVPHFNENTAFGDLFRIGSRFPPHNLYTSGQRLGDLLRHANAPPVTYRLWPRSVPTQAAPAANRVTVPISNYERPTFTWLADRGGFTETEADTGIAVDANTRSTLIIPTVIVQRVPVTTAPEVHDVNGVLGVNHDLNGSGTAQVFTGGYSYDATWTQPALGPPQFARADGSPVPIASGLVWICLIPVGSSAIVG